MENKQLLSESFRKARITRQLSESSIEKYTSSISRFFSVIGEKPFEAITVKDFEDYILEARIRGADDARIANVISGVKWALAQMQTHNLIDRNIDLVLVKKPKIGRKEVNYLTENEIWTLIDCIGKEIANNSSIKNIRFMTLIMFLLQTGARIGEALSIDYKEINQQNAEVAIIGKGQKPRTLFLKDETMDWIRKYMSVRNDDNEALFVSLDGKSRWMQTDIGRSLRRFRKLSGIQKKFSLHTMRHTFATQYLSKHVPLNTVQFLLGHSSPMTTLKFYVGAIEKENARKTIQDEHFNFIPSAAIVD